MRSTLPGAIIFPMTPPIRSSKILLVATRRERSTQAGATPVRRYRLARVPRAHRVPATPPRSLYRHFEST